MPCGFLGGWFEGDSISYCERVVNVVVVGVFEKS
jgi:hypothetical protein